MNDRTKQTPLNPPPLREVARNVYECLFLDIWPSPAGIKDFGLDSTEHYGALQYAVKHDGVTVDALDAALGWGPALTKLISKSNPYHGVTFRTDWDTIMVPIKEWAAATDVLFPLGRLFATPGTLELATQREIVEALRKHAAGDWGDGDKSRNDAELEEGNEILSCYRTADGHQFFVRTWFTPPMMLALLEWQLDL
jgi:hypothetical protein